jgi:1-aminocyclopropane-1-carboxylate deaminase
MYHISKSKLDLVNYPQLNKQNIKLFIKRDDLIHPEVSGNKWRKLKYNIEHVLKNKLDGIMTFGGAYSNHLLATASACNKYKIKSIGVVRGDELNSSSNFLLKRCEQLGMQLIFISRSDYQFRNEKWFAENLSIQFPKMFIVPEGGANYYGLIGCQEIIMEIKQKVDDVFVALGTGTTAAGISMSLPKDTVLHVISALKGFDIKSNIENMLLNYGFDKEYIYEAIKGIQPHEKDHFGGYGKYDNDLVREIIDFNKVTGISLDPLYTGKVWVSLKKWILENNISNKNILMIHTGGVFTGQEILKKGFQD